MYTNRAEKVRGFSECITFQCRKKVQKMQALRLQALDIFEYIWSKIRDERSFCVKKDLIFKMDKG